MPVNTSLPADEGLNLNVPGLPPVSFLPDLSYLAPNCFNPSQKLHAKSKEIILLKLMFIKFLWFIVAKILWNNLFQSHKQYKAKEDGLWCPSREEPNFLGGLKGRRVKVARIRRNAQSSGHCTL